MGDLREPENIPAALPRDHRTLVCPSVVRLSRHRGGLSLVLTVVVLANPGMALWSIRRCSPTSHSSHSAHFAGSTVRYIPSLRRRSLPDDGLSARGLGCSHSACGLQEVWARTAVVVSDVVSVPLRGPGVRSGGDVRISVGMPASTSR